MGLTLQTFKVSLTYFGKQVDRLLKFYTFTGSQKLSSTLSQNHGSGETAVKLQIL